MVTHIPITITQYVQNDKYGNQYPPEKLIQIGNVIKNQKGTNTLTLISSRIIKYLQTGAVTPISRTFITARNKTNVNH